MNPRTSQKKHASHSILSVNRQGERCVQNTIPQRYHQGKKEKKMMMMMKKKGNLQPQQKRITI